MWARACRPEISRHARARTRNRNRNVGMHGDTAARREISVQDPHRSPLPACPREGGDGRGNFLASRLALTR